VEVRKQLTEIIDEIDQHQRISGFFATSVMKMAYAMRAFSEDVDQRFDVVDQRFDAVDQRFDVVDQRLTTIDTKVDLLADEVRKMGARQEELFGWIVRSERQGTPPTSRKPS
jgi:hypothetical protein